MKPRLLDLFCGAGGAAKGYQEAGFYVVGVDIAPQPNYCGDEFIQTEALHFLGCQIIKKETWSAIHASPPCQDYSRNMRHLSAPQPRLIEPVRALLNKTGVPWVIENVEGAPLPSQDDLFGSHGVVLCGTSFGMRVYRHRWFETSFPVVGLACDHRLRAMNPHNVAGRKQMYAEFGRGDPEKGWAREMGVEWMGRYEAREAIPPAYTRFIGEQLRVALPDNTEGR